jgi:hypothetical protein
VIGVPTVVPPPPPLLLIVTVAIPTFASPAEIHCIVTFRLSHMMLPAPTVRFPSNTVVDTILLCKTVMITWLFEVIDGLVVLSVRADPPTGVIELPESLIRAEKLPAVIFTPEPVVKVL